MQWFPPRFSLASYLGLTDWNPWPWAFFVSYNPDSSLLPFLAHPYIQLCQDDEEEESAAYWLKHRVSCAVPICTQDLKKSIPQKKKKKLCAIGFKLKDDLRLDVPQNWFSEEIGSNTVHMFCVHDQNLQLYDSHLSIKTLQHDLNKDTTRIRLSRNVSKIMYAPKSIPSREKGLYLRTLDM